MKENNMKKAFLEAKKAYELDEIPVGCVIIYKNEILACGYNQKERMKCSTKHAEIVAIEKACQKLETWYLDECELYVTLEPCMMCLGAIIESRIKKVYYGAKNNSEQMYDYNKAKKYVDLTYLENNACSKILSDFFVNKRKN